MDWLHVCERYCPPLLLQDVDSTALGLDDTDQSKLINILARRTRVVLL